MGRIDFVINQPHEEFHLGPLRDEARQLETPIGNRKPVRVLASSTRPAKGAWNVQVFHGLGNKGYTLNPIFLQKRRFPRVRTALGMATRKLRLPVNPLAPPTRPGKRPSRYQQINAYGPRFRDYLTDLLVDVEVSTFGHIALNAREKPGNPQGYVLWLPTWDNRATMGGPLQSSLNAFAEPMAKLAADHPIKLKPHPLTIALHQADETLSKLGASGVEVLDGISDPYDLLAGAKAVLTDSSSLGFEAAASGLPVAILKATNWSAGGIHDELDELAPTFGVDESLKEFLDAPRNDIPKEWREDLLFEPRRARNTDFAFQLMEAGSP